MADRRLRVGVLFGGRSSEHEVSLQSARAVMDALEQAGHEVIPIGISKTGRFLVGGDPLRALSSGDFTGEQSATMLPEPGGEHRLQITQNAADLDVLFPVLHGTFGEDGTVQGLFELAAVPYAGAGVLGSALGMDKVVQKTLWRGMGLPVVDFVSARRAEVEADLEGVVERIEATLGYPCFTKPANLGSSVGVSKARDRTELESGLHTAA